METEETGLILYIFPHIHAGNILNTELREEVKQFVENERIDIIFFEYVRTDGKKVIKNKEVLEEYKRISQNLFNPEKKIHWRNKCLLIKELLELGKEVVFEPLSPKEGILFSPERQRKREENIAQYLKEFFCDKKVLILIGTEHLQSLSKVCEKYGMKTEYLFFTLGYEAKGQLPLFPVYHEEILTEKLRKGNKKILRDLMHRRELSNLRGWYEALYSFSQDYRPKLSYRKATKEQLSCLEC